MSTPPVWPYAQVIAHRGGGKLAPENTIAAIKVGQSMGFKGIEFDVMLSSDSVPLLMHDDDLNRTCCRDDNVQVSSLPASELLAMDAGSWFSSGEFAGELIPSYDSVIDYCKTNKIWMNVEIKPCGVGTFDSVTGRVVAEMTAAKFEAELEMLKKGDATDVSILPLFSSFSFDALMAAKVAAPGIPRAYLIHSLLETLDWRDQCRALEVVSVNTSHQHLTAELAAQIKADTNTKLN